MLNSFFCTKTKQIYFVSVSHKPCTLDKTHKNHLSFPIDDLLVYPLTKLWELGVETQSCCSGHLHRKSIPHVSFVREVKGEEDKTFFKKIYKIAKELENQIIKVLDAYEWDANKKKKIMFRVEIPIKVFEAADIKGKLNLQQKFILFLLELHKFLKP